jgi:hypothetical protein
VQNVAATCSTDLDLKQTEAGSRLKPRDAEVRLELILARES